jgi:cytochrome P450
MILQAPFTPRGVASRGPALRERSEKLLQPLVRGEEFEFLKQYAIPYSLATLAGILDLPQERWPMLERSVWAVFRILGNAFTADEEILDAAGAVADLNDYLYELIDDRRSNLGDDYLSVMLQTRFPDGSEVETSQMAALVFTLISAGFDSTANTQTLGIGALLSHPDQWARLRSDRSLMENAIDEILRYRTLVKRLYRRAKNDVVISGVPIPAGAVIALLGGAANHDQDACEGDPERFELRPSQHVAFGRGIHFCVGAPLARLQIKTTLETMLDLVPDVRLAAGRELEWGGDFRFDGLAGLYLDNPAAPPESA